MCDTCESLREQVKELKLALSVYESPRNKPWHLPGHPDIPFTPMERYFVRTLYERMGRVVDAYALLEGFPGRKSEYVPRKTVDVLICRIRRKLLLTDYRIETAWGKGYAMTRWSEAATPRSNPTSSPSASRAPSA